jgi:hypothetical protein
LLCKKLITLEKKNFIQSEFKDRVGRWEMREEGGRNEGMKEGRNY